MNCYQIILEAKRLCGLFVARQLMEKTKEHEDSLFMMFVNLKKAYNSVHRNAPGLSWLSDVPPI